MTAKFDSCDVRTTAAHKRVRRSQFPPLHQKHRLYPQV